MISLASKPYIDASVPVLRSQGIAITTTFYRNLFFEHPELKNLFNMGNQAQGTQQESLAAAVVAYAANIDNPEALKPVINRIAHKHASLGISAKHYPIVGRHLLGAIKETLGETATPPLLNAWSEAYTLLADVLIAEEKKLYGNSDSDRDGFREMQVIGMREESELVRSFTLIPTDGEPLSEFLPGQYITVAIDFPDGTRQLRQYSLSDSPERPHYRISVKREPERKEKPSGQVSNWLHNEIRVNDHIEISQPFGDFTPNTDGDAPLILLSAGVGITPMISTLNHLSYTRPGHQVIFAHATYSKSFHSHIVDVEYALERMRNLSVVYFYENMLHAYHPEENIIKGEMRLSELPKWDIEQANVYLCGPLGFMKQQWEQLLLAGVPKQRLHREVFGPSLLDHLN